MRQAVKDTQAVGGEEIPAPATSPTEIQLAGALEAWARNVGLGRAA